MMGLSTIFYKLKNNYKIISMVIVFLFFVVLVGQMISVIGSRQVVEPINIIAFDKQGRELNSFKRFMQLARAGNITFIKENNNQSEKWLVSGVFVKKLIIGISKEDLNDIANLNIFIGDKKFNFIGDQIKNTWIKFDKSLVKPDLQDVEYGSYALFEVPADVSLSKSNLPVYKNFFGSLINWGGDSRVLLNPIKHSVVLTLLVLFLLSILWFLVERSNHLAQINNLNSEFETESQKRFVYVLVTVLLSVVTFFLADFLISFFYKPNISLILEEARKMYVSYFFKFFRPKPVERLQFLVNVSISPFVIFFYYAILRKKNILSNIFIKKWHSALVLLTCLLVWSVLYLGLSISNFFFIEDSFFSDWIGRYIYSLVIFPIALIIFLTGDIKSKYAKLILQTTSLAAVVSVLLMNIFGVKNVFNSLTFDPVYYPVTQLMAGKHLLVNLVSLYGLFPIFLYPLLKLIGFGVFKFSLVMSFLLLISFIFLWFSIKNVVKNRWLLYLGFLNLVFYSFLATRTIPDYYYQYWPIRFLFPCLGLFLISSYLKIENKILYIFSFLAYSIGILWNFDVGVVVFLSWIATLVYNDISKKYDYKVLFLSTIKHLFFGIVSFILVFGLFTVGTFLISGQWPIVSLFSQYQKLFLSGYLMINMIPPPHMWCFVILIYVVGLAISLSAIYDKKIGYIEKNIFLLSIMGVGLFAYYQGQSMDAALFRTSYPALILIVIFADYLINKYYQNNKFYSEIIFLYFIFYIVLSAPFNFLFNVNKYIEFAYNNIVSITDYDSISKQNIDFIKRKTFSGESLYILAYPNQAIYYGETNTRSFVDVPSIADVAFPREMNKVIDFLKHNKEVKIFVQLPFDNYDVYDPQIEQLLKERYVEIDRSASGLVLLKVK